MSPLLLTPGAKPDVPVTDDEIDGPSLYSSSRECIPRNAHRVSDALCKDIAHSLGVVDRETCAVEGGREGGREGGMKET
jgi:hypothetical protein